MKNLLLITLMLVFSITCFSQKGKWKKAQKINTIENYQYFIANYPESEFKHDANLKLIELEYNKAKMTNTINGYKYFLDLYENNTFTEQATNSLIELEFTDAKKENTINTYENFARKYPESDLSEKAKYLIVEIEFEKVKKKNSVDTFKDFIQKYPNNNLSMEALDLLIELEFKNVKIVNTVEAYEVFIRNYPDSELTYQANKNLSLLIEKKNAWENVIRNPSLESYFRYVKRYPTPKMTLSNDMLKEIANNARPKRNYIKKTKSQLSFSVDTDNELALIGCPQTMNIKNGLRLYTSPSVSSIRHYNDSSYFIYFYSNTDNPLIVDFYHNKFELNISHFSGKGYILINVGEEMKIWDLN